MYRFKKQYMLILSICVIVMSALMGCTETTKQAYTEETQIMQYYLGSENTKGNMQEGGLVAEDSEWIYFTNSNHNDELYKKNKHTGQTQQLTDKPSYNINLSGENVYYTTGIPGPIYRMRKDGSENTMLIKKDINYFLIREQNIFMLEGSDCSPKLLYVTDLQGEKEKLIVKNLLEFDIYSNVVYYTDTTDNYSIHSISLNGDLSEKINDCYSSFVNIYGDCIYYSNHDDSDRLYKYCMKDKTETLISSDSCWNINIRNGFIYYRSQSHMGSLFRMNLDGTNNIELYEGNVSHINLTDTSVVFEQITENAGFYIVNDELEVNKLSEH